MGTRDEPIKLPDDFEDTLAALLAVPPKGSDTPPSAEDVAAALITAHPGITQMQLHKMLYLVQAAHLAWYGSPAFKERIEAWRWGPIVRTIAGHYKHFGKQPIMKPESGNPDTISPKTHRIVQHIVARFGDVDAFDLADTTKVDGSPWKTVWGDRGENDSSQEEIPVVMIANFHRKHGLAMDTPTDEELPTYQRLIAGDRDAISELLQRAVAARTS